MSIQTLAPVPLDLVKFIPTAVQLPVANAAQLAELVIANESPVQLIAQIGPDRYSVEAWTADKFKMPGSTFTVVLTPQSAISLGAAQQPPALTAAAVLTFSSLGDEPIQGTYPTTLTRQQSAFLQQVSVATVNAGAGQVIPKSFTVPDGTQAIGWLQDQTVAGNPHAFTLQGLSTLTVYASLVETQAGFGDGSGLFVVPVPSKLEPAGFTFTLDQTGHGAGQVDILAFLSQPVVYVKQNRTDFFNMTNKGASPASWQAPNLLNGLANPHPVSFGGALAAGASFTMATGNAGNATRLFQIGWSITGAANCAGQFEVGTGVGNTTWLTDDWSQNGWRTFTYFGGQIGALGDSLFGHNTSAVNLPSINGSLGISNGPLP